MATQELPVSPFLHSERKLRTALALSGVHSIIQKIKKKNHECLGSSESHNINKAWFPIPKREGRFDRFQIRLGKKRKMSFTELYFPSTPNTQFKYSSTAWGHKIDPTLYKAQCRHECVGVCMCVHVWVFMTLQFVCRSSLWGHNTALYLEMYFLSTHL